MTVAAIAVDVQAVVMRDSGARLSRMAVGDVIPGTLWRVARVIDGQVTFEYQQRLNGVPLNLGLKAGEHIDFAAVQQRLVPLRTPQTIPESTVVPSTKHSIAKDPQKQSD